VRDLLILDLALSLFEGESRSGALCPACKGGSTGEKSLHLSRRGRYVYYKCYRAKCDCSGRINVNNSTSEDRKQELGGKRRVLETSPVKLDDDTFKYLTDRYSLSSDEIRRAELGTTTMHTHAAASRLYIPMFRRDGTARGYVARDLSGKEGVKALSMKWRPDEPNLAWYNNRASKQLIIVEDCFSAIRASSFINSCALLGTDLSKEKVDEIMRGGFTKAYISLDADATRVAIMHSLKHRTRLSLIVKALTKDIKDMTREELETFMRPLIDGT
jgi:hypothetical protein